MKTYLHLIRRNKSQTLLQTFRDSEIPAIKDWLWQKWRQCLHDVWHRRVYKTPLEQFVFPFSFEEVTCCWWFKNHSYTRDSHIEGVSGSFQLTLNISSVDRCNTMSSDISAKFSPVYCNAINEFVWFTPVLSSNV